MSPRTGGSPGGCLTPGKDRTLVGLSIPRQSRLRVRTAASSVSRTLTSPSAGTRAAAATIASRTQVSAPGSAVQRRALSSALPARRPFTVVGRYYAGDQFVADDVLMAERDMRPAFNVGQQPHGFG